MSFEAACTIAQMQQVEERVYQQHLAGLEEGCPVDALCPVHGNIPNCGWPANDVEPPRAVRNKYVHTGFECGAL